MTRYPAKLLKVVAIGTLMSTGCVGDGSEPGFEDDLNAAGEAPDLRGVRLLGAALSGEPKTGQRPLAASDVQFRATGDVAEIGVLTISLRECAPGTVDCPCGAADSCGAELVCSATVCRAPCGEGGTCDAGQTCDGGACRPTTDGPAAVGGMAAAAGKRVVLGIDTHLAQKRLLVNGRPVPCETSPGVPCVDAAGVSRPFVYLARFQPSLKRIDLQVGVGASVVTDASLVLDYRLGTFLPGVSPTPGLDVTVSAGSTWELGVVGSARADALSLGATGFAFNRDATPEIRWDIGSPPSGAVIYAGAGNDTVSAMGNLSPRALFGNGGIPVRGRDRRWDGERPDYGRPRQ